MSVKNRTDAVRHQRATRPSRPSSICPSKQTITSALLKAAHVWFTKIGTPFAKRAADLVLTDHDAFLAHCKSFDMKQYDSAEAARGDYLVASLLKKANFLSIKLSDADRKERTIEKWVEAERRCAHTNERLAQLIYETRPNDIHWIGVLSKARHFISRLLGPAPKLADLAFRFGPGSTYLVKNQIVKPKKYGPTAVCTPNLLPFVQSLRGLNWPTTEVVVVDGNTLGTVPKTAEIDRPIGIEPDMNIYVQLALGAELRSRFKPYVDLDHGQDVNRRLASVAHEHKLSTIDLANASDTVCYMLVMLLLPEDWFDLLDCCRSPCTIYEGKSINLEKFSSMGNGYTFELESIIFYALARASGSSEFWTTTYGDDIIINRESYDSVVQTLEFFGFEVNSEKSFKEGDFFESCGHDYFKGINIRPVYWKKAENVTALYKAANDVSRWSLCILSPSWSCRDAKYRDVHSYLSYVLQASNLLFKIPHGIGDVGLIADFDDAAPQSRGAGLEGFTFKVVKYKSDTQDWSRSLQGYLAQLDRPSKGETTVSMFGVSSNGSHKVPVRGSGVYVASTGQHHCWPNLGPWM